MTKTKNFQDKIKITLKLIKLTEKKAKLLKEFYLSIRHENAKVIVSNVQDGKYYHFMVFLNDDSENIQPIFTGTYKKVLNYLAKYEYTEIVWDNIISLKKE